MAHSSQHNIPPKACVACGRPITWRKKWARDWAKVKYCSVACRRVGDASSENERLERAILSLLSKRAKDATICPSEVARQVSPDGWRELMEPVRRAGRRLAAAGRICWTSGGRVVDPKTAKGPVRFGHL